MGVFTRSPRSYTNLILELAYPTFAWDIVIAHEDVQNTKPHGDGIIQAMDHFNLEYLDNVVLVGDSSVDIKASYNCGCYAALESRAWPPKRSTDNWNALSLMPDALLSDSESLSHFLEEPFPFFPKLESIMVEEEAKYPRHSRFDKINHFIPKSIGGDTTAYPIFASGRSFANYPSLAERKKWHPLTKAIAEHKDANKFPDSWIQTVRSFISLEFIELHFGASTQLIVTSIPHRPGRTPRLEQFLAQFGQSLIDKPMRTSRISVEPGMFRYTDGVRSHHTEHLDRPTRFANVRDHLIVAKPELAAPGNSFLIIDDVTTTGASLIYAREYLRQAGARDVKCLSMAKNISNVLGE
nr:HAD hydrolase-like protein [Verrucomicrobium sp. BvORR034]